MPALGSQSSIKALVARPWAHFPHLLGVQLVAFKASSVTRQICQRNCCWTWRSSRKKKLEKATQLLWGAPASVSPFIWEWFSSWVLILESQLSYTAAAFQPHLCLDTHPHWAKAWPNPWIHLSDVNSILPCYYGLAWQALNYSLTLTTPDWSRPWIAWIHGLITMDSPGDLDFWLYLDLICSCSCPVVLSHSQWKRPPPLPAFLSPLATAFPWQSSQLLLIWLVSDHWQQLSARDKMCSITRNAKPYSGLQSQIYFTQILFFVCVLCDFILNNDCSEFS